MRFFRFNHEFQVWRSCLIIFALIIWYFLLPIIWWKFFLHQTIIFLSQKSVICCDISCLDVYIRCSPFPVSCFHVQEIKPWLLVFWYTFLVHFFHIFPYWQAHNERGILMMHFFQTQFVFNKSRLSPLSNGHFPLFDCWRFFNFLTFFDTKNQTNFGKKN